MVWAVAEAATKRHQHSLDKVIGREAEPVGKRRRREIEWVILTKEEKRVAIEGLGFALIPRRIG